MPLLSWRATLAFCLRILVECGILCSMFFLVSYVEFAFGASFGASFGAAFGALCLVFGPQK